MPVALVTGSATGVGRACVLRFAREGYDVVVNYTRSETEARETVSQAQALGVRALLVRCNVGDEQQVLDMIRQVRETFGRLDILVNNAATTHFVALPDLNDMTSEKWDDILAVNLKGPFFVSRAAAELLKQGTNAAIVNVSSIAGLTGNGSSIAYCASKGGLNTLTKSLARVLAPTVRVNAVCPGEIDTRWLRARYDQETIDRISSAYPIPRPSTPEEIAEAVAFLALKATTMTGHFIQVDSGRGM